MASLQVRGKEQLTRVADVLTEHADSKAIARKLRKAIRDEAGAITRDQRASLAARMPKRGGLAESLSTQGTYSVRTALSARSTGVTIVDSWKGHDMPAVDAGSIRHPLWGNRKHWYTTSVPKRLLTKAFLKRRRGVQLAIIRGLDELAAEIAKET